MAITLVLGNVGALLADARRIPFGPQRFVGAGKPRPFDARNVGFFLANATKRGSTSP